MMTKVKKVIVISLLTLCFLPLNVIAQEGMTYSLSKIIGEWKKTNQVFDRCENYISETLYSSSAVYVNCRNNDNSSTFFKVTFNVSGEILEDEIGTFYSTVSFYGISAAGRFLTLSSSRGKKDSEIAYRIYDAWNQEWTVVPKSTDIISIDMSDSGKGLAIEYSDNKVSYIVVDHKANVIREDIQFAVRILDEDVTFPNAISATNYRVNVVAFSPNGQYASVMVSELNKAIGIISDFALFEVNGLLSENETESRELWSVTQSESLRNSTFETVLGKHHTGAFNLQLNSYATTPSELMHLYTFVPWKNSAEFNKDSPLVLKHSSRDLKEVSLDIKSVEQSPIGYQAKNNRYYLWDGTEISNIISSSSFIDNGGFYVSGKKTSSIYAVWYDVNTKQLNFYRATANLKTTSFPIDQ